MDQKCTDCVASDIDFNSFDGDIIWDGWQSLAVFVVFLVFIFSLGGQSLSVSVEYLPQPLLGYYLGRMTITDSIYSISSCVTQIKQVVYDRPDGFFQSFMNITLWTLRSKWKSILHCQMHKNAFQTFKHFTYIFWGRFFLGSMTPKTVKFHTKYVKSCGV